MVEAAQFLIEKRVLDAARHATIITEGELAQKARARVQFQHLLQEGLPLSRACFYHLALAEHQSYSLDGVSLVGCRDVKGNHPVGAVLNRAGEEFAAGEVAFAVAIDEDAVFDGERQVCASAFNMNVAAPFQPIDKALLLRGDFLPARYGIGVVQEAGIEDKFFKFAQ